MRAYRHGNTRPFDWATAAPWLTAALLLPVGALLIAYLLSKPAEPSPAVRAVATNVTHAAPDVVDTAPSPPTGSLDTDVAPAVTPEPMPEPIQAPTPAPAAPHVRPTPPPAAEPVPAPPPAVAIDDPAAPTARYGNRTGSDKGRAISGFGGSEKTETSVRVALDWLAAHQRADGAWDRMRFNAGCPEDDVCRQVAVELEKLSADPAVTGLAVLAFLGAGHTDRAGDYQSTVSRGLAFLLLAQRPDGSFTPPNTLEMYNHAIATLALGEASVMTGEPLLRAPLEAAVGHIVRAQQPGGGWGYTSNLATDRNDMSVTGWIVMALAGADSAGVRVPDETVLGLLEFVAQSTLSDGQVNYAREGSRIIANAAGTTNPAYSPATTAIGMLVRQLLGIRRDAPILQQQQSFLLAQPPDERLRRGGDKSEFHSDYYWYYGTLALFNQGGDAWDQWNHHLLDALLPFQDRSPSNASREGAGGRLAGRPHTYGSFEAFGVGWGKWGRAGGRVYATALAALMLESYYRYVPAYLSSSGLIRESTLRLGLSRPDANRLLLVQVASLVSADVGEPVLLDLIRDADAAIRLRAAMGLARLESPMGEAVLRAALPGTSGGEREAVEAALAKVSAIEWPANYGPIVRVDEQRGVFVFSTEGRPVYAGMQVEVNRDGRVVAKAVVTRRLTEHNLAAARATETQAADRIRPQDAVTRRP